MNCRDCGLCCKHSPWLLLYPEDQKRLSKISPKFRDLYQDRIIELGKIVIIQADPCPFFDSEAKLCHIYEYRPQICRIFPLIFHGFSLFEMRRPLQERILNDDEINVGICNPTYLCSLDEEEIAQMKRDLRINAIQHAKIFENPNNVDLSRKLYTTLEQLAKNTYLSKQLPLIAFRRLRKHLLFADFLTLLDQNFTDPLLQRREYELFIEELAARGFFQEDFSAALEWGNQYLKTRLKKFQIG